MTDQPERFKKLPQWAQREILGLKAAAGYERERRERAEEAAKATLSATRACVWINPYDPVPAPVTTVNESVRFALTPDGTLDGWNWIDVKVNRDRKAIEIMAARGVNIRARASNTFEVSLTER